MSAFKPNFSGILQHRFWKDFGKILKSHVKTGQKRLKYIFVIFISFEYFIFEIKYPLIFKISPFSIFIKINSSYIFNRIKKI